jgi:hypothetical protein
LQKDSHYQRQRRNTQCRLKGTIVKGKRIVKVGSPIDRRLNYPTLIPVQFANGTHGVLWSENPLRLLESDNPKVNRAIRLSVKMPLVGPGIGSDVLYINVFPKKKGVVYASIKVYYNDKAGRGDLYKEMTEETLTTSTV